MCCLHRFCPSPYRESLGVSSLLDVFGVLLGYMYEQHFDTFYQWGQMGWGPEQWIVVGALLAPVIILGILWAVVWKGLALWHAARRGQYWWFLILLVVNTFGILEIIYLFLVAKLKFKNLFTLHSGHTPAEHTHHS